MLNTTRLLGRMLAFRRATLISSGRPQRARRASAYHALSGISDSGCFCQNRRSVEIAITRIGESMLPRWEHGQLLSFAKTRHAATSSISRGTDETRGGVFIVSSKHDAGKLTMPYWYYCADPEGYYPYVQNCPTAWMLVAP